jgi:hypothetical protein
LKTSAKQSRFAKPVKQEMETEDARIKFVPRPNLGMASEGESKTVQAIDRRNTVV